MLFANKIRKIYFSVKTGGESFVFFYDDDKLIFVIKSKKQKFIQYKVHNLNLIVINKIYLM